MLAWRRILLSLVIAAPAAWLALVALLAGAQTALLFPGPPAGTSAVLPQGAEALTLTLPDGTQLVGQRLRGRDAGPALILGFGGNGWDARTTALYLHRAFPDHDVASFHYRGYPPSGGRPSGRALQADAVAIFDSLAPDHAGPVLAVGISLGAGPAAHLAAARPLDGVILMTAYDSLTEVARDAFPWAPVRLLFRHPMAPAADLARSAAPVALISASRDRVIPAARTQALRTALGPGRIVLDRTIPGDHDGIHLAAETRAALRTALAAMIGP